MDKIYLVSEGEYSDYSIVGAFSTEEKAQALVDVINARPYSTARIEIYHLDSVQLKPGHQVYHIWMNSEGNTPWEVFIGYVENGTEARTEFRFSRQAPQGTYLVVTRYVETPEHAVKIANELRTQWLAQREWPELKHWNEAVQYDL